MLSSFRLVLEGKAGKDIFVLSDAEENISGLMN